MASLDIIKTRLNNQQLYSPKFTHPEDVVAWFGAIQSQDFAAAKWALALRTKEQTDESIEQAFNKGLILRTHVMRPTWHFVTPKDIRWLLALTSPRVLAFNGYYFRKSGLDKTIFEKSNAIIRKSLDGKKQLTRSQINIKLQEAKIPTKDLGLSYIIMQAELNGIICSGPRQGKQFTYMLLDERVQKSKEISREEALYELIKRYFQSHGPAQIQDFTWWSGLTVSDAKKGISLVGDILNKEVINGKVYWFIDSKTDIVNSNIVLIPGFDEYFIAYKDRSEILDKKYSKHLNQGGGMINGAIVINGRMIGCWKRYFHKKNIQMKIKLFENITKDQEGKLGLASQKYGKFLKVPVVLQKS